MKSEPRKLYDDNGEEIKVFYKDDTLYINYMERDIAFGNWPKEVVYTLLALIEEDEEACLLLEEAEIQRWSDLMYIFAKSRFCGFDIRREIQEFLKKDKTNKRSGLKRFFFGS